MAIDNKKLALIHIIKKELELSDEEYRAILRQSAGVDSAKDLTEETFRKLMNVFVRSRHYRSCPDGLTLRQKLFIKDLSLELGWDPGHLNSFVLKYYHKPNLSRLSKVEAGHAIESLKNIIAHARRGYSDPSNQTGGK